MQQDYNIYKPLNEFSMVSIENEKNDEIDMISNAGDSLLIDLVKNYPHLYDKSLLGYKDLIMKENSWTEIAKIMHWTPVECQNRWTRLRERFSKERREIEAESKSGSGASYRKDFALYENMKFLSNHVLRRQTHTNISQDTKNKENIPQTSPHPVNKNFSPYTKTCEEASLPNVYEKSAYIEIPNRNHKLLSITPTNTDYEQSELRTSFKTCGETEKSEVNLPSYSDVKKNRRYYQIYV